jgi:hypothetical protein
MLRQTDFQFRVLRYNPTDPAATTQAWSEYVKVNYLDQGWQIMSSSVAQVSGQEMYLAITFVKYADDTESLDGNSVSSKAKK